MKSCPTSILNRSEFWGFEVSHIVSSFVVLATTNVILGFLRAPLLLSWAFAGISLAVLRLISHGQKHGHLELLGKFLFRPHVYLGHAGRTQFSEKEEIEKAVVSKSGYERRME